MKVPMSWLMDYVDINVPASEFGEKMTMSGTKVEKIEEIGKKSKGLVAGKILKIERHPNADRLVVCSVDIASKTLEIITGATNVFEGAVVPVATCGCVLPNGVKIKKSRMRGVTSLGMLCSEEELGLSSRDHDGILILSDDYSPGDDLSASFCRCDSIVEFELTSNRPDCQGIIGIAREAAVTLGTSLLKPLAPYSFEGGEPELDSFAVRVEVEASDDTPIPPCRRYAARIIKNVRVEPSPGWIADRLVLCGIKPVNNIVDITNYVMLEYGQPMHAFDLNTLKGSALTVRYAHKGESFLALDNKQYNLDDNTLVVADAEGPAAIAGIIGGVRSSVTEATSAVILESANFEPSCVRRASSALGIKTDSCSKFEKSLPESLAAAAMNRACGLISELGFGEVESGLFDYTHDDAHSLKPVEFNHDYINRLLGTDISSQSMKDILLQLGFTFKGDNMVVPPSFRTDVSLPADLAEEVARFYGYDNIPETCFLGRRGDVCVTPSRKVKDVTAHNLVAQGFCEIMTYSFVDEKEYDMLLMPVPELVRIRNPLGVEHSVMRTTPLGSMLSVLVKNINCKNEDVRLFEFAEVYTPAAECINPPDQLSDNEDYTLPGERGILALGMYDNCDFYDLKGCVENLFDSLGVDNYSFKPCETYPSFHPGKAASVFIGVENVGIIGSVNPLVLKNYGIKKECFAACMELEALVKYAQLRRVYKPVPKYPSVRRDIAVAVSEDTPAGQVYDVILRAGKKLVSKVSLFDVYRGEQVESGTKSLAYSIFFSSDEKTLTDEDVSAVLNKITERLKAELNASFR